jgi:hypothetical protein
VSSTTLASGAVTSLISGHVQGVLASHLHRVHIVGGPGSGKTSLSQEVGARTHLPVHHLDDVARVGGGDGPVRDADERDRLVAEILAADGWVTEGVHLGWTDPILRQADVVVWLDYVDASAASRRIMRRFVEGAINEMRSRPMRERFTRFGDYARNLRSLGGAIRESRRYYQPAGSMPAEGDDDAALAQGIAPGTSWTWTLTADAVAAYQSKLIHCRTPADVDEFLRRLG